MRWPLGSAGRWCVSPAPGLSPSPRLHALEARAETIVPLRGVFDLGIEEGKVSGLKRFHKTDPQPYAAPGLRSHRSRRTGGRRARHNGVAVAWRMPSGRARRKSEPDSTRCRPAEGAVKRGEGRGSGGRRGWSRRCRRREIPGPPRGLASLAQGRLKTGSAGSVRPPVVVVGPRPGRGAGPHRCSRTVANAERRAIQ